MNEAKIKSLEDTCAERWRAMEKMRADIAILSLTAKDLLKYAKDAKTFYVAESRSWDIEDVTKSIDNAEYFLNKLRREYYE